MSDHQTPNLSYKDAEMTIKIPGVPECYNYGVYHDDGFDYSKHLMSMKEFVQDPNFVVMDDDGLPPNYVPQEVEPVFESLDPDFDVPSDDELIEEQGELEDDFVALAGGKRVQTDDDESALMQVEKPESRFSQQASLLPLQKVKMMERFLFGTESTEHEVGDDRFTRDTLMSVTAAAALRKGRPLTEQEELLERQFSTLLKKTQSSSGFDGRSLVSGVSMMSDSLHSAIQADRAVTSCRRAKEYEVGRLDASDKATILQRVLEISDSGTVDTDPLQEWIGPPKPAVGSISTDFNSAGDVKQPPFLRIPRSCGPPQQSRRIPSKADTESDTEEESGSLPSVSMVRIKGETPEERRLRKNALKSYRRDRKQVKKHNKEMFRKDLIHAHATGQVHISHLD